MLVSLERVEAELVEDPDCFRFSALWAVMQYHTAEVIEGYSWWGVGKVEPGPELFFFDPDPGSTFCIC